MGEKVKCKVTIPAPNTNSNSKRNHSGNPNKPSFIRWKRIRIAHLQSHPRLTLANKAVGVAIIERANHRTGGWSIAAIELAAATGLTSRAARSSIKRLRAEGLLAVKVIRGRNHKNYLWPLPAWNPNEPSTQPETPEHNQQNRNGGAYYSAENRNGGSPLYRSLETDLQVCTLTVPVSADSGCKENKKERKNGLPRKEGQEASEDLRPAEPSGVPPSAFLETRLEEYAARVEDNRAKVADLLDSYGSFTFAGLIKLAEYFDISLDRADLRELFGAGVLKTDSDGNLELVGGKTALSGAEPSCA
jgi:hypothetical protein